MYLIRLMNIAKKTSEDIRREENRRMTLSIGVIAIIILGGGGCYTYLEGWSFMDAIYFSSMTTLVIFSPALCHLLFLIHYSNVTLLPSFKCRLLGTAI